MPSRAPFTVKIVVDDVALEEHEVTRKNNTYSCWIASQEGKNFAIHWNTEVSDESYKSEFFMDGSFVSSIIYKPEFASANEVLKGCTIDSNTLRLFTFSRVSLTDDDAVAALDQRFHKLGTIEIKIYRATILGKVDRTFSQPKISSGSVIHERSKKMSMHNVTLGEEIRRKASKKCYKTQKLDKEPCVTFVFTYRPREFLVAQGIIPPTIADNPQQTPDIQAGPSDEALAQARKRKRNEDTSPERPILDDEDVSEENIQQLRQTLKDVQARLDAFERRKAPRPVKKEIKHEQLALSADSDGVIDLTSD